MLITLEGIEGSGKSTQMDYLAAYFQEKKIPHTLTREPGGTGIGKKIRSVLLDPENINIHPITELLLYAADRLQHVQELILPMMRSGHVVICDRFHDSTIAYQGHSRGIEPALIQQLNQMVLGDLIPDITFLLDLDPEIGLRRAWKQISEGSRDTSETRFEHEKIQFHERVRNAYLELADKAPKRFVVIDAANHPLQVRKEIIQHLEKYLASKA